jgi:hypothetical protein
MPGRLRLECRTSPFRFSLLGATRIAGGMLLSGAVLIATLLPVAAVSKGEDGPRPVTKSGTSGPKSPGRELRLHFRLPAGMTLPANFQPQVYVESDRDEARLMWQPEFRRGGLRHANLLPVHATGTGEFEVRLLHPDQPFYVAIHTPGFLRFSSADRSNGPKSKTVGRKSKSRGRRRWKFISIRARISRRSAHSTGRSSIFSAARRGHSPTTSSPTTTYRLRVLRGSPISPPATASSASKHGRAGS